MKTKGKAKRLLTMLLAFVMVVGLIPTAAMAMDSQAEYTGVCTHGSHEGYIELTSEYLTTHYDRLNSGKYYLSEDLDYSGSWYLDVAENATVELCLNGHTLTFSNEYLLVRDGASLLLENGKVKLESSANKVIWGYSSEAVEIRNCDIDGNGTATYLVFINGDTGAQEVKITDSKLHNICDSSYAAVSMFGENPLGSLDISRTDIYDLAGSSNGIYLDCATAKISNCTLDGGGIVNSLAHISEVSNVSITKNGIGLRNDGTIDIIKNCTIVSEGASIQNEGLIKEISGGSYTYNPSIFQEGALQNSGTINNITSNAEFFGAPAIKNEGSGKITITDAEVLGSVDGLTAGFAIYGYAVTPSATGMVTINGGNYSCAVYDPNNTSAAEKLFPDGATGIIINSGNFEHSPSANLLAPNKAIVNSGITDFPYAVGEQDYTVTYELDGGTNNEANPVSYNSSVGIPELKAPVKADYAFLGWTLGDGTNYITAVPAGTTGDITLKAHWEYKPVYYTVKLYDINGFSANQQTTTNVANGATYTVLLTATSNEYLVSTFDEYHVRYENGTIVSNATSSYDETAKTVTITIPNVSANIEIICKARICSHDYEEKVITPATCTTSGSKTLTCKICSNVITPVTIEPLGHSYSTDYKKENADADKHYHVCMVCSEKDTGETHTWNVETATEETDKHCVVCGYVAEAQLTHTHKGELQKGTPATTEADGVKDYYECRCGKFYEDEDCTKEITDLTAWKLGAGRIPALPSIIEGTNGVWTKGSADGLKFKSNAEYANFLKVLVDNAEITAENYEVKEGSTVVTLKAAYLETLSVGKHTLSVVSTNGTATTEFEIKAASVKPTEPTNPSEPANPTKPNEPTKPAETNPNTGATSPQTGDNSHMALWIALLLASCSGLVAVTVYGRKKKVNR